MHTSISIIAISHFKSRSGEPVLVEFGRAAASHQRAGMSSGTMAMALMLTSARVSVAVGVRRVLS
jgi:hypothetical protein